MKLVSRFAVRALPVFALACLGAIGPQAGAGTTSGGTLRILGSGDLGHLDPVSDYQSVGAGLTRMFARQLVSNPDDADFSKASALAADVAKVVPSRANGGISKAGRVYIFDLRPDVMWDTTPPRAVSAADFVRGFAMLCNPASPTGAPGYYTSTIVGMAAYCSAFSKVAPTAPAIAAFVNAHKLAGVAAPSPTKLVITLARPASDFLNIVAMGFASARPAEYMKYVPDSAQWRQHTISNGPYKITKYTATKEIDLDRNPAWKASSDPLRKARVDHVQIVEGLTEESVQQQLEAGTGDMDWDVQAPTQALPRLLKSKDPRLVIAPGGKFYSSVNYLAVNLYAGPMRNRLVRAAVATAVNKDVLVRLLGGPRLNTPATQMIFPGSAGYIPSYTAFPANGGEGNAAAAKKLLAQAGFANGVPIKLLYPTIGPSLRMAQALQVALNAAGFKTELVASNASDYLGKYLLSPDSAKRDTWDITPIAWAPDWFGNNGRSIMQPLFTDAGPNSPNYGGYKSAALDKLIGQALTAESIGAASAAWGKADESVLTDVAAIPLFYAKYTTFHSSRVHACHALASSLNCDPTNVSLD